MLGNIVYVTIEEFFSQFNQSKEYKNFCDHPVAYFCAEFALKSDLPIYAGGLGVLAGDLIKEAFDRKFPMLGVGLYYYAGYRYSAADVASGSKALALRNPEEHGLKPVLDKDDRRVVVNVPIEGRSVAITAWQYDDGTAPVYLLDTNIEENDLEDRKISWFLYTNDRKIRIKQQMILGIGGYRFLKALGIVPSYYHLNEGNSAFLAYEMAKEKMYEQGIKFMQAQEQVKDSIVFTNHTLVAAGHDVFENELFSMLFANYADEIGVPCADLIAEGEILGANAFSMTRFALRSSGKINAVSQLHGEYAEKTWPNYPIVSITNGVHVPTWDRVGKGDIVGAHKANKQELLRYIQEKTGQMWGEDELLIGWARRVVKYKRPLALFDNINSFLKLANTAKPVRCVFSGRPHPQDRGGQEIVKIIKELADGKLKGHLVYLDDYDIELAQKMVSGSDVWLNTPFVGFEACGTSGMKAALNGSLLFSTDDGWMAEVDFGHIGWSIESTRANESLISTLTDQIVPEYYDRKDSWQNKMIEARKFIQKEFSASRMLKDYIEKHYTSE